MQFKYRLLTQQCFIFLLILSPAAANANTNTVTISGIGEYVEIQTVAKASAWVTVAGLHPNIDTLLQAIATSDSHGLNTDRYHLRALEQELESFVDLSERSGAYISESNTEQRIQLEKSLDQTFSLFSRDLGQGVLNAQDTQQNLHREAPVVNTTALLARLHSGQATVKQLLTELIPSSPQYKNLVSHMEALLRERDSGTARTKVTFIIGAKQDTAHELIVDLRSRLIETGDLGPNSELSSYFDNEVTEAVKAVQKRHGIAATGELTQSTVDALNTPVDDDIEKVAMSLERWRWMPRELGEQYIMVNVPSYNLTMTVNEEVLADMAVVVGSKKHHTPIFSEDAAFIEVAPTWTVPASIANNELIPIERERPGYLEAEKMDFFVRDGDRLVSVPRSYVTQADLYTNPFPYVLRQRAGADNALGKIKILMPNRFAVYMHDTQAKKLFAKTDRAYSHGCIRLSDPFLLGRLLLVLDGRSLDETEDLLSRKSTKRVKLNNKTPTHISYFTALVDDEGKLHKYKDVYEHNEPLLAGLLANNTLLSTLKSRPVDVLAEHSAP